MTHLSCQSLIRRLSKRQPCTKWILCIALFLSQSIQGAEPMASKKYAEQGIVELSGTGSAGFSYDAISHGALIDLSSGLNYFLLKNWYVGAWLSFQYSSSSSGGYQDSRQGSPTLWSFNIRPAVEFGYSNLITERWYWFGSAGYAYYDAGCNSCSGAYFINTYFAKAGAKYDLGNALIILGVSLDTGYSLKSFWGFSLYF
jgi:hypothetical protein